MIIIYRAANIADAHLIRQMLEAEGIYAFIQGEYLQGAVGELPANTEILLHVADENAEAARVVIDAWNSAEPVVPEDAPTDDDMPTQPVSTSRYSLLKAIVLFVIVVLGGMLVMSLLFRYAQGLQEV